MNVSQTLHNAAGYDFRQYDRIWKRVAPDLEPYPGMGAGIAEGAAVAPMQAAPPVPPVSPIPAAQAVTEEGMPAARQEQLPGADPDPCCMGTAAQAVVDVVAGFVEEELADRRYLLAMSRQAPAWARQRLRDMAAEEGAHARRLMAAYYLITGECYRPAIDTGRICIGRWCPALRERYHMEACGGLNYAQAADGTTDPCLQRIFNVLSREEYRHAVEIMEMLERSMENRR